MIKFLKHVVRGTFKELPTDAYPVLSPFLTILLVCTITAVNVVDTRQPGTNIILGVLVVFISVCGYFRSTLNDEREQIIKRNQEEQKLRKQAIPKIVGPMTFREAVTCSRELGEEGFDHYYWLDVDEAARLKKAHAIIDAAVASHEAMRRFRVSCSFDNHITNELVMRNVDAALDKVIALEKDETT